MSDDSFNPYPWGPHGARQDGPGPPVHPADAQNPSTFTPPPPFQPVTPPAAATPLGGPFTAPSGGLPLAWPARGDFLLNLIFVGIFWEVWVCLYPLSALAGLFTLFYSLPFLRPLLPVSPILGPGLYSVALAIVLGVAVLWTASRLEHRLARSPFYRVPRHLLRLLMIGWAVALMIQKAQGLPYDVRPAAVLPLLKDSTHLGIVIGAVVACHFILWNWRWPREFWHRRLVGARLRPFAV